MDLNLRMDIALESQGRTNGTSYTNAELALAREVGLLVLIASGFHQDANFYKTLSNEVKQAANVCFKEARDKGSANVPSLSRAIYTRIEKKKLADSSTTNDFPRIKEGKRASRGYGSIGIMLRGQMLAAGVAKETVNKCFPSSYNKNKTG